MLQVESVHSKPTQRETEQEGSGPADTRGIVAPQLLGEITWSYGWGEHGSGKIQCYGKGSSITKNHLGVNYILAKHTLHY